MQHTIRTPMRLAGTGLHTGRLVRVVLCPAPAHHGVWFRRTDLTGANMIPARHDAVAPSPLCTMLVNEAGASVSTVEHLMAALAGAGVHNAVVDVDGPELPILDGSAAPFGRAIARAGRVRQDAALHGIEVLRPVEVRRGAALARLVSAPELEIDFAIAFPDAAIGAQRLSLRLGGATFARELADCRTFCRQADVAAMRAGGRALGGSLANAVVVDGARVLNPEGLRRRDEPVRHKMLDALGDLALAGAPILGRYEGERAGHALTNALLHALFADPASYRIRALSAAEAARLPGASERVRAAL